MAWTWRCEDTTGAQVEGPMPGATFPNRADAESWLGEIWQDLLDGGVDQVRLYEDGREVYGPMSLHSA
ncbi:MAG TPA: hypothetical protein VEY14_11130 [Nocardioidaceae bacterium]|jgi:hypothetical protein|nr:hypothetical protein [Nocardioidaceae bacterium]